jgi:NAD(P)-dependent dehydrogenase (short-subunit alcohol dehydrogenase family)
MPRPRREDRSGPDRRVGRIRSCRALVERTKEAFGRIDMLINNAGLSLVGGLEELPDLRLFHYVMDVNFYGALACCFYALPCLLESHGRIVNVSSVGGLLTVPYNTSYCASKFALPGFSDSSGWSCTGAASA